MSMVKSDGVVESGFACPTVGSVISDDRKLVQGSNGRWQIVKRDAAATEIAKRLRRQKAQQK